MVKTEQVENRAYFGAMHAADLEAEDTMKEEGKTAIQETASEGKAILLRQKEISRREAGQAGTSYIALHRTPVVEIGKSRFYLEGEILHEGKSTILGTLHIKKLPAGQRSTQEPDPTVYSYKNNNMWSTSPLLLFEVQGQLQDTRSIPFSQGPTSPGMTDHRIDARDIVRQIGIKTPSRKPATRPTA